MWEPKTESCKQKFTYSLEKTQTFNFFMTDKKSSFVIFDLRKKIRIKGSFF